MRSAEPPHASSSKGRPNDQATAAAAVTARVGYASASSSRSRPFMASSVPRNSHSTGATSGAPSRRGSRPEIPRRAAIIAPRPAAALRRAAVGRRSPVEAFPAAWSVMRAGSGRAYRIDGGRDVGAGALCNALCNGLHSARPLIPVSWRGWWGAWIRPLPPYVTSWTVQEGSDPVPPRSGGEGSADGRGGAETRHQKDQRRTENQEQRQGQRPRYTRTEREATKARNDGVRR